MHKSFAAVLTLGGVRDGGTSWVGGGVLVEYSVSSHLPKHKTETLLRLFSLPFLSLLFLSACFSADKLKSVSFCFSLLLGLRKSNSLL